MIHRTLSSGLALVLSLGLVACGPGEPGDDIEEAPDTVGAPVHGAATVSRSRVPGASDI